MRSASPAEPLGLVGENRVGKSTLARTLAGREDPDAGTVARPEDLAYLGQEPSFRDSATVGSVLDAALAPVREAVARLEELATSLEQEWAEALRHSPGTVLVASHDRWLRGRWDGPALAL